MKDKESDLYGYICSSQLHPWQYKECYLDARVTEFISFVSSNRYGFLEFLITSQSQIVIDLQVKEQYLRRDFLWAF